MRSIDGNCARRLRRRRGNRRADHPAAAACVTRTRLSVLRRRSKNAGSRTSLGEYQIDRRHHAAPRTRPQNDGLGDAGSRTSVVGALPSRADQASPQPQTPQPPYRLAGAARTCVGRSSFRRVRYRPRRDDGAQTAAGQAPEVGFGSGAQAGVSGPPGRRACRPARPASGGQGRWGGQPKPGRPPTPASPTRSAGADAPSGPPRTLREPDNNRPGLGSGLSRPSPSVMRPAGCSLASSNTPATQPRRRRFVTTRRSCSPSSPSSTRSSTV